MRHVTDEADLARVSTDHFGPLVPPGWSAVGHEEGEQTVDPVAPAQANETAQSAGFVRGVILILPGARRPRLEFAPIALEGGQQHALVEPVLLVTGIERDGGRRSVEIAQADRTGDEVDLPMIARGEDRSMQVAVELVAGRC